MDMRLFFSEKSGSITASYKEQWGESQEYSEDYNSDWSMIYWVELLNGRHGNSRRLCWKCWTLSPVLPGIKDCYETPHPFVFYKMANQPKDPSALT